MWPTSEGDRTLQGSEAVLLATAIDTLLGPLVDYLGGDDETDQAGGAAVLQTGVAVFDTLPITQRIAALHHAAEHLLSDTPLPGESLSAADDATVAAIYSEVRDQVEIEIDLCNDPLGEIPSGSRTDASVSPTATTAVSDPWPAEIPALMNWRRLVYRACCEVLGDDGPWAEIGSLAELAKLEIGEWELWIDCLASAILWDRDFEFAESFLDADPDAARRRRAALGITDDYFVRPAPDPSPREIGRLIKQTRRLVRSVQANAGPVCRPPEDKSPM